MSSFATFWTAPQNCQQFCQPTRAPRRDDAFRPSLPVRYAFKEGAFSCLRLPQRATIASSYVLLANRSAFSPPPQRTNAYQLCDAYRIAAAEEIVARHERISLTARDGLRVLDLLEAPLLSLLSRLPRCGPQPKGGGAACEQGTGMARGGADAPLRPRQLFS